MGSLFVYSLETSLMMTALYIVYKVAFRGSTKHRQCRTVLLLVVTLSLLCAPMVALCQYLNIDIINDSDIAIGLPIATGIDEGVRAINTSNVNYVAIAIYIYGSGVIILIANTLFNILKVLMLIAHGKRSECDDHVIIITENKYGSFSWFGYSVLSEEDYRDNCDIILCHEKQHLQLRHWVDLLYVQMVKCLTWYNPVIFLLTRDLQVVHEYQADSAVLSNGFDAKTYQMLLLNKVVHTSVPAVVNGINNSQLKLRIIMMLKRKQFAGHRIIAAILAPIAIAASVIVINQTVVASEITKIADAEVDGSYSVSAQSQNVTTSDIVADNVANNDENSTATQRARMPQFKGGESAMIQWLYENVTYPSVAVKDGKKHKVWVRFSVTASGEISNPTITRSESITAFDNEAIRVIGSMPDWEPGINEQGKAAAFTYVLPITFSTTSGDK